MRKKNLKIIFAGILLVAIGFMGVFQTSGYNSNIIVTKTGHKFTEEYWAIEYDVLSGKLVEDLIPGDFAEEMNDTFPDRAPYRDANFYISYINLGPVQTLYMAFTEYSNDNRNTTRVGIAPYQIMQQHFRTPAGKHVIVQNSFAGLVAYQEINESNGVPNKDDNLFYGNSLNSQFNKYLLNHRFSRSLGFEPLNMADLPTATPKLLEKTTNGDEVEYSFGIDYENIFIVWHSMHVEEDINNTITAEGLLDKIVAFSSMDYLNFTYKISGTLVEDQPINVTTTTEYDIGPLSDLWVVNDEQSKTELWDGIYYDLDPSNIITDKTVSRYNTTASIEDRLNGDESVSGFSLAITNYARMTVISANINEQDDVDVLDGNGTNVDGDNSDVNVSSLDLRTANKPAFNIDFASKPNYTLNGGNPMSAPVKLYPQIRLKDGSLNAVDHLSHLFLNSITRSMVQARIEFTKEKYDLTDQEITIDINRRNVFYAICFPQWEGKSINQDPTFTAIADPVVVSTTLGDGTLKISGYAFSSLLIFGIGIIAYIMKSKKFHKR
ncbi:hypothetical protein [Candidatus Lokiarchaeum ossiferum]|uniref:hypothetical protein n=1 Tax=Candidatus Lokiarchaeum ossiferum TaxID=2951803 RepID=UPI00352C330D